jgi:hypothetical protein
VKHLSGLIIFFEKSRSFCVAESSKDKAKQNAQFERQGSRGICGIGTNCRSSCPLIRLTWGKGVCETAACLVSENGVVFNSHVVNVDCGKINLGCCLPDPLY